MEITKEFTFEAAHRLDAHDGKCSRLHGHSYRVEVAFVGDVQTEGPKTGMVIDFGDISKACMDIAEALDHRFLMAQDNQQSILRDSLDMDEMVMLDVPTSTAEHLAEMIARMLFAVAPLPDGVTLSRVTVWETATSSATWRSRLTEAE